ncbi:hypothetical protein [Mesorhizobium sp. L48C026A00]|uniref:hypothetical protein n=1 Tax=Mesorhizobium sp. L48C026A00 TaxID=1287182 RepID=UPI0012ECB6AF|nr:hypothetical protein [Mesorhizobium sp. L48C026A00]
MVSPSLAAGGGGGGMRWPNRTPHVLTPGMRRAQRSLADFLPLIDWASFRRAHLGDKMRVSGPDIAPVACGAQAVVWLVRSNTIGRDGMLRTGTAPIPAALELPGLARGTYRVIA